MVEIMNILFGLQRKINLLNLTQKSQFKDSSRLGITEFYDFKRNPIWVGHCTFEETKGQKPGVTFLTMLDMDQEESGSDSHYKFSLFQVQKYSTETRSTYSPYSGM